VTSKVELVYYRARSHSLVDLRLASFLTMKVSMKEESVTTSDGGMEEEIRINRRGLLYW